MGTININGKYTSAKIFTTDNIETAVDDYALKQIELLCNLEANADSIIRVMPDVHPGKVGTIGLTMTIGDKLMPNLTGIDIGCGISMIQVKTKGLEFQKIDRIIRENIPSGFNIRSSLHHSIDESLITELACLKHIDINRALLSCGSLGSGNHFIELDKDEDNKVYATIHSGSRRLGKEITEFYLKEGQALLKEKGISIPYELTYLEGQLLQDYLHDVEVAQQFAKASREIMLEELAAGMKWKIQESYNCHHNYIDFNMAYSELLSKPVLRKGAISATEGEAVIIPINMKEGIILGSGKGNKDWNYSAPHGSGRVMKREDIKNHYTLSQFKKEMKGIYSESISKDTLDEAPFAYRGLQDIQDAIKDTVTINKILRPIYNYKAGGNE